VLRVQMLTPTAAASIISICLLNTSCLINITPTTFRLRAPAITI
jgi:hypothetical protein